MHRLPARIAVATAMSCTLALTLMPATSMGAGGTFAVSCPFAKAPGFAFIDPIVAYGKASSHQHVFKGNKTITAKSTYASLRRAGANDTTCKRQSDQGLPGNGDLSSYWAPTLIERNPFSGAEKAVPIVTNATYYSAKYFDATKVQPIPAGLKLLAGDVAARSLQNPNIVTWVCGDDGTLIRNDSGPQCVGGSGSQAWLQLRARFPSCWDGRKPYDAATEPDRTRVNYDDSRLGFNPLVVYPISKGTNGSSPWTCPTDHPIPIPEVLLLITYQTSGGPYVRPAYSNHGTARFGEHADFFDGWDRAVMNKLVRNCIRVEGASCGTSDVAAIRLR